MEKGEAIPIPTRDKDGYYQILGDRMPSVTTIISKFESKEFFHIYEIGKTVSELYASHSDDDLIEAWVRIDDDYAGGAWDIQKRKVSELLGDAKWISGAGFRALSREANVGNFIDTFANDYFSGMDLSVGDIPNWIETTAIENKWDPDYGDIYNRLLAFMSWIDECGLKPILYNCTGFSEVHSFAGKFDMYGYLFGEPCLIDWKKSENLTESNFYQLGGYSLFTHAYNANGIYEVDFPTEIKKAYICRVLNGKVILSEVDDINNARSGFLARKLAFDTTFSKRFNKVKTWTTNL